MRLLIASIYHFRILKTIILYANISLNKNLIKIMEIVYIHSFVDSFKAVVD